MLAFSLLQAELLSPRKKFPAITITNHVVEAHREQKVQCFNIKILEVRSEDCVKKRQDDFRFGFLITKQNFLLMFPVLQQQTQVFVIIR